MRVFNPYAEELTFISDYLRNRRDQQKYLTLIKAIALLHQHQRQRRVCEMYGERIDYIEVEISDIELANRLIQEVLGRCLDELAPQTRKLLEMIHRMVMEKIGTPF